MSAKPRHPHNWHAVGPDVVRQDYRITGGPGHRIAHYKGEPIGEAETLPAAKAICNDHERSLTA